MTFPRTLCFTVVAAVTLFSACGGVDGFNPDLDDNETEAAGEISTSEQGLNNDIAFTPFTDSVGSQANLPRWRLFKTAASYSAYFGHSAPSTVNFARDWVFFYSAGSRPTGGYTAAITRVFRGAQNRVYVATSLKTPGAHCMVTQAFTNPYVLVKFAKPAAANVVRYLSSTQRVDCAGPVPTGPICGGIAGLQCAGAGTCVDDPSDSCNPANGGADCSGHCACNSLGMCVGGGVWNSSPEVCGCEAPPSCATVLCGANTYCTIHNGQPACLPNPSQVTCGSVTCGSGMYCCNASCGICAPPGSSCIQLACSGS